MTSEHLKDILKAYARYLSEMDIPATEAPVDWVPEDLLVDARTALMHCAWMCEVSIGFVEAGDAEKAMRWLGFIQGAFWLARVFTIAQMREHSRPAGRGGKLPQIGAS